MTGVLWYFLLHPDKCCGSAAWLWKSRKLSLLLVMPASCDDDDGDDMCACVRVCVCARTTWKDDRLDRTVELHAPSIREQTAWSGIFLDELIRDHLAQKFSAFLEPRRSIQSSQKLVSCCYSELHSVHTIVHFFFNKIKTHPITGHEDPEGE